MIFSAVKQDGRLVLTNKVKYDEFVSRIKEGQLMTIEAKRKKERITSEQRSYLHLSLRWLGKEVGYTEDQMKTAMKEMFFYDVKEYKRTGLKVLLSTEKEPIDKIAAFTNDIDEWAISFLGYGLPPAKHIDNAIRSQR